MIAVAAGLIATLVIALVIALMLGHGGRLSCLQRVGVCAMAAGLVWAGPARFLGYPPGLGDLLFVAGLAVHLTAIYGPAIRKRADL